jgi:Flp pilus assembly pilin Flp
MMVSPNFGEMCAQKMLSRLNKEAEGQALVEFALILVVLLTMIFAIIESARLFQGWLTVQNAARAAGRYAITGQFEPDCLTVFPPCLDPRVDSIEDEARRTVAGVPVDPTIIVGQPSSLSVEVWGQDEDGVWYPDYAGASGQNLRIRVTYYMPVVTPLLQPIADMVPLTGQVVAINEDFDQFGSSMNNDEPPSVGNIGGPVVVPEADIFITKVVASPDVISGPPPSIYTIRNVKYDI